MSSSILSGDFTVYYEGDTGGSKQITWAGSASGTRTAEELYLAIQDLFDDETAGAGDHMDEGIPMLAYTPSEYAYGKIELADKNAWFIDFDTAEHLTAGAMSSINSERDLPGDGTGNIGLLGVPYSFTSTNFQSSDIGKTITHDVDSDSATLLYFLSTGALTGLACIRPDSNELANDWNSTSGGISVTGGTAVDVVQTAAASSGNVIYANNYSIGSLAANTLIYIIQNGSKISSWWSSEHIDVLIRVKGFPGLIDLGYLTFFARQYGMLYDHYQGSFPTGGRNPVPFSTSNDINNNTGYRAMAISSASGVYTVGEKITGTTSTAEGIVTATTGSPTTSLDYYLVGTVTTDFQASETVTGADSGITGTSAAPSNTGPAAMSGITFTFGADTKDLSNGNGSRPYDVVIDCGGYHIDDFYEYTKYVTRRGSTTTLNGDDGEQYTSPGEIRISYEEQTVNFLKGATLTGQSSSATGVITADHDAGTTGTLILKKVRGTFSDDENIQDDQGTPGNANILATGGINDTIIAKTAPFGTFAGGKFFGAQGVYIHNMHADDANNYSLTDSENVAQNPPSSISIVVNGLVAGDRAAVFRANADYSIDKTYMSSHATNNAAVTGFWEAAAGTPIPQDTPSDGIIRLVDTSAGVEEKISYTSWTGNIFTLSTDHSGGYGSDDTAYVPYIDAEASGSSLSQSVTYAADRNVLARVRLKGIVPFNISGTLDINGYSTTAIRNIDDIITL